MQDALSGEGSMQEERRKFMKIVFEKAPRNTVQVSTCVVRAARRKVNLAVHDNNCEPL